jgi:hypothetical protein
VVLAAVEEPSRQCDMVGGFRMTADIRMEDAQDYDWDCIVIPGGGQFVCVVLVSLLACISISSPCHVIVIYFRTRR